jgi:hypothetical protein
VSKPDANAAWKFWRRRKHPESAITYIALPYPGVEVIVTGWHIAHLDGITQRGVVTVLPCDDIPGGRFTITDCVLDGQGIEFEDATAFLTEWLPRQVRRGKTFEFQMFLAEVLRHVLRDAEVRTMVRREIEATVSHV